MPRFLHLFFVLGPIVCAVLLLGRDDLRPSSESCVEYEMLGSTVRFPIKLYFAFSYSNILTSRNASKCFPLSAKILFFVGFLAGKFSFLFFLGKVKSSLIRFWPPLALPYVRTHAPLSPKGRYRRRCIEGNWKILPHGEKERRREPWNCFELSLFPFRKIHAMAPPSQCEE